MIELGFHTDAFNSSYWNFEQCLGWAQRNGLQYAFVERDVAPDPIASIRASHDYLKTVLSA